MGLCCLGSGCVVVGITVESEICERGLRIQHHQEEILPGVDNSVRACVIPLVRLLFCHSPWAHAKPSQSGPNLGEAHVCRGRQGSGPAAKLYLLSPHPLTPTFPNLYRCPHPAHLVFIMQLHWSCSIIKKRCFSFNLNVLPSQINSCSADPTDSSQTREG